MDGCGSDRAQDAPVGDDRQPPGRQAVGRLLEVDLGVHALPLGDFTFGPDDPWPGEAGLVVGYAIRHPRGVFVFDTGFALAAVDDPELGEFYEKYRVRPRPVLEALRAAGIDREEVTAIANCHLHLDHCGQNELFPGVPIYVQPEEWAAAHEPDYTVSRATDFPGARFEQIAGDHEAAPGLRILATPGHSPGHQSLVVDGADGLLLLVGQAVYSHGEWAGIAGARSGSSDTRPSSDPAAYRRSVDRLRALNPKRVLFGHDRRGWPD
jgi:glyoxylase-like metal-dependent hydrolase (beta-lactamase superfamily II)